MTSAANIPVWREIGTTPPRAPGPVGKAVVTIVGGGPVGLAVALDLGRRGQPVLLLNKLDFIPAGSKAICFSKRSLDLFDRLGVGQEMVDKGVVWNVGKVFRGDRAQPIFEFDLLPVKDQKRPAFINLQQYHVEERLYEALAELPNVEMRWGHEAIAIAQDDGPIRLDIRCEGQSYSLETEWLIACDGARSPLRTMLALDFEGAAFQDNFLIADIMMEQERPAERWFWFDPPFNRGRSALLHKQPDHVWRLDFQLGSDVDRAACARPGFVERQVRAMLGDDVEFSTIWSSVYTFQCRRMARFVHGRVIFAGDSAHLVSPFGARGANGGLADIDNLGWKLDLVLKGEAPKALLESYDEEAGVAADENIRHSTRSIDFITPKSSVSRSFRDAVLELAETQPFARPLVNSGRLSTAVDYLESPLNSPDDEAWERGVGPGSVALDAPLDDGWLLERLGDGFTLLADCWPHAPPAGMALLDVSDAADATSLRRRYQLDRGAAYLIRPDQYVAARWRDATLARVAAALTRASGGAQ